MGFMPDSNLTLHILEQVYDAIKLVEERSEKIKDVNDFTDTPDGKMILDSICMLLIAIGDSLKKIDKITDKKLLSKYTEIDWTGAKGSRDIIAHHYFDVDASQIYYICKHHIQPLSKTIKQIILDLENNS